MASESSESLGVNWRGHQTPCERSCGQLSMARCAEGRNVSRVFCCFSSIGVRPNLWTRCRASSQEAAGPLGLSRELDGSGETCLSSRQGWKTKTRANRSVLSAKRRAERHKASTALDTRRVAVGCGAQPHGISNTAKLKSSHSWPREGIALLYLRFVTERRIRSTYQNIKATDAKSASEAATG